MIWDKKDINREDVINFSQRFDVDSITSSIMVRRGITQGKDVKFFLEDDPRFLYNPFLFSNMENVVDRLNMAATEGEKVLVFGDKDVDGVTSCVILYNALTEIGLDVTWKVPEGSDGYGLTPETVEEAYNNDITLIVCADCGTSSYDSSDKAKELGLDIIVLDHHNQSGDRKEPAVTDLIINPKLKSENYPCRGLAACGVSLKLLWALCFSKIETLYKSRVVFFNISETEVSILKLYNLNEFERHCFDKDSVTLEEIFRILGREEILVYNKPLIESRFSTIFGKGVEFNSIDIKPELTRVSPNLQSYNLKDLVPLSRVARYTQDRVTEVDVLSNIFITYVLKRYNDTFKPFFESLDLAALGTIADLMPLRGENRIIVRNGLKQLESTENKGLRSLLISENLMGRSLSSRDVSWGLSPILNSAGRMKQASLAVKLLLPGDDDSKNIHLIELLKLNRERREITQTLWDKIYPKLYKSLEEYNNRIIVIYDSEIIKGVTGLLASRIYSSFKKPAIVMTREDGVIIGSIRSNGELDISGLFTVLKGNLENYGGHNCAAGFSFLPSNLDKVKNLIRHESQKDSFIVETNTDSKSLKIDAEIPSDYLKPDIIDITERLEPYGEGFKPVVLSTQGALIKDIKFLGRQEKKHLKLLLEIGEYKWPAMLWNGGDRAGTEFNLEDRVSIAYSVERNNYGGKSTIQLNILDINRL